MKHGPIDFTNYCRLQQIATITAIEFCEIFTLDNATFKKYVQTNDAIMEKLNEKANMRLKQIQDAEEEDKKQLNQKFESFEN